MATITAKDAVDTAYGYLLSLYPNSAIKNVLLEEVEFDRHNNRWLVTIGFDMPVAPNPLEVTMGVEVRYARSYKLFTINADTKEVESMKIRVP